MLLVAERAQNGQQDGVADVVPPLYLIMWLLYLVSLSQLLDIDVVLVSFKDGFLLERVY